MTATDSTGSPGGQQASAVEQDVTPATEPGPEAAEEHAAWTAPRWPAWVGLVLSVAGVAVAGNLTYAHYTSTKALGACPDTGFINCAKVTTSQYSHIFGLPVAVLGLAFFLAMIPLNLPVAWRSQWRPLRLGRVAATVVGVGMICWLIVAELFRLHSICLYCTVVHGLTVLLFVATVLGTVSTAAYEEG